MAHRSSGHEYSCQISKGNGQKGHVKEENMESNENEEAREHGQNIEGKITNGHPGACDSPEDDDDLFTSEEKVYFRSFLYLFSCLFLFIYSLTWLRIT